jgi:hypothetical protein
MRKGAYLFLFIFSLTVVFAQKNTQKALLAIQQNNFGLAQGFLQKDLLKAPVAASYGWAVYYLTPFCYQADSAFAYLSKLEQSYPSLDVKSKAKLQIDLAIQDTTTQHLFHQLATQELQSVVGAPQITVLELFMERYGQKYPEYKEIVVVLRDSLAFDQAVRAQSSAAMQAFIVMYPNAVQQQKAKASYEVLLYQEGTQHDTEAELIEFITVHANSPYTEEAWERIYKKYSQVESLASLTSFIKAYPTAPQVATAWKQIYRLYMQTYSVEKLAAFKRTYPEYPFIEDLEKDGELLLKQLYPFIQEHAYGYMDATGVVLIEAQYEDASAFYEGLAIVSKASRYGLINKRNEQIIAFKYLDISPNKGGFILEDSSGYLLLDAQGQFLQQTPLQWEELQQTLSAYDWQEASVDLKRVPIYERILRNSKVGLNKNGKVILAPKYDDVIVSDDSPLFIVKQGKSLHYFDTTGKRQELNGLEWFLSAPELALFTKEGYAVCSKSGKLGLIDTKGKLLLKHAYEAAQPFWGGLWPVQQNGKWGLIAIDGKVILPLVYQKITAFAPFGFLIEQDNKLGLIDASGKWILNPEYKTIKRLETNYFLAENQNGLGLFVTDGTPIIACGYQRIVRFDQSAFQLTSAEGLAYYLLADQKILMRKP